MSQQSLKDRYAAVMMNAFGAPLRVAMRAAAKVMTTTDELVDRINQMK